jgi:hypothetical protein
VKVPGLKRVRKKRIGWGRRRWRIQKGGIRTVAE